MRVDVSMDRPGATAIYPYSAVPGVVDPDTDRRERHFAWFTPSFPPHS
ncbi:hypothetical protein ABZZ80_12595 [Streptomyces sp. NPDC006356]